MVGVVQERERAAAGRLGAAGGGEDDGHGERRQDGGCQQREPFHASSFWLVRRRRTTAVPVSTRNTSARTRNADQPIAASVPLLSGTPLAVNASAASPKTIAIARGLATLFICVTFPLGFARLAIRRRPRPFRF